LIEDFKRNLGASFAGAPASDDQKGHAITNTIVAMTARTTTNAVFKTMLYQRAYHASNLEKPNSKEGSHCRD
jgi:hypothetical protein